MFPFDYIYSTKRYFVRERNSRVQRTKFYESNGYFGDALSPKIRMNREKNGVHFISFYLENRPRDQILFC
jgi:hypothetical protein